jgi:hypothetical protein
MWVTRFWFWGIYILNIHVPNAIDKFFFSLWHVSPHLVVPSVILGLSLFVVTIFVRKDSLKDLGIRLDNIKPSGKECFVAILIGANLLIAIFFIHHEGFTSHSLQYYFFDFLEYTWWGTVQQFVLQSIIFVRMGQILKKGNITILAVSVIFSLLHAPHIPFMILTFICGLACCILFSRHRNIFTLGITHAVFAVMAASLLVPSVIDNFRTGPLSNWDKAGIADFNADGVPDILWRNTSGSNIVWYMDENGTATKEISNIPYCATDWQVDKIADFNADGVPDILWRNTTGSNAIWYMDENGTAIKRFIDSPYIDLYNYLYLTCRRK